MGVPAFFRWLSRKYPSVIIECVENKTTDDQGNPVYEDSTKPNPNGVEFDNLYLDMNGIIHPCTHPEDKPPPKNEDEMMVAIFECIDRLFAIVRPRKILYMAIDGVAPRAKMNQQRSRRFRAAKESIEKQAEIQRVRSELLARGCELPPEKAKEEHFDSNCITPGTPFMDRLSRCLHYYIHDRMNTNPAWRNIKVILSDANVPGEGEHKIMDYIRKQRSQPDHDPNTQHVLCGADADLIMLGLATHEPNFTIIREEFLPNKPRPCEVCGLFGHEMDKCHGLSVDGVSLANEVDIPVVSEVKFIFVRLSVLREYLKRCLAMPNLPFEYDFDRAIDDWVFMCFFVGNDFLPHLPSLEIREGAVDRLVEIYKKFVYKTKGYLTNSGEVDLDRVQLIMTDLGSVEDQIFKSRQQREEHFKARENAKRRRMNAAPDFSRINNSRFAPTPLGRGEKPEQIQNMRTEITNFRTGMMQQQANMHVKSNTDSKQALESMLRDPALHGKKRKSHEMAGEEPLPEPDEEEDHQVNDEVRLWEDGFKDRYYESKFDVGPENKAFRYSVALQYVRGLCWVLKYYYQGCASWKWYFPYHYAPFASDFVNIAGLSTAFEKGTVPFAPLEQLMGVFPAASSSHVPEPWADLMSNPKSTIIDFYPEDFKIDLNGKKFAWQGVALLPFVDERRLFKALKPLYKLLTPDERRRNTRGDSRLYVAPENPGYTFLISQYKKKIPMDMETPILIQGMQGRALLAEDNVLRDGILSSPIMGLQKIVANVVLTVRFRDPEYADDFIFPSKRLPKAQDPPNILAAGGSTGGRNFRPAIGFNSHNVPRASLSNAGHRMVNNYSGANSGNRQQQDYSAMGPPNDRQNNYTSNLGSYGHHRQQQSHQQGGNNSNYNNRNFSNNNNNRNFGGPNRYNNNNNNNNNQRGNGRNNDAGSSSGSGNWVQMSSFGGQSGSQGSRRGNRQGGGGGGGGNQQRRRF